MEREVAQVYRGCIDKEKGNRKDPPTCIVRKKGEIEK
jgi:hypothetical protein